MLFNIFQNSTVIAKYANEHNNYKNLRRRQCSGAYLDKVQHQKKSSKFKCVDCSKLLHAPVTFVKHLARRKRLCTLFVHARLTRVCCILCNLYSLVISTTVVQQVLYHYIYIYLRIIIMTAHILSAQTDCTSSFPKWLTACLLFLSARFFCRRSQKAKQ